MKLRVHEILDAGALDFDASLAAEDIPLDLPDRPVLTAPVEARIHAEKDDEGVIVLATLAATVRLTCSRCVESFEQNVPASFEVEAPASQTFVDVTEEARQALLLAMPVKPLCRADCRGICPLCGKNRNRETCACAGGAAGPLVVKLKDFKIS